MLNHHQRNDDQIHRLRKSFPVISIKHLLVTILSFHRLILIIIHHPKRIIAVVIHVQNYFNISMQIPLERIRLSMDHGVSDEVRSSRTFSIKKLYFSFFIFLVVYCDYTASGRPMKFIENYIRNNVLPL